jgi:uncharacterized membrane protein
MVGLPQTNSPSPWLYRRVWWSWLRVVCIASVALGLLLAALMADASQVGEACPLSSVPSPFLRFYSMLAFSALAYIPQWLFGDPKDYRMALRHGMAAGFVLSGIDHFVSTQTRYVPMLPPFLVPYGAALVYGTGATELAGAIGLVVPLAVYRRLGLPNLRQLAGIGIALMLACLTLANINVAVQVSSGQRLAFEVWTYWLRLCFQPLFIIWALYAAGVIKARAGGGSSGA